MSTFIEALAVPNKVVDQLEPFVAKPVGGRESLSGIVLGSFKFYDQIIDTIRKFNSLGIDILAPKLSPVTSEVGGFKLLSSDKIIRDRLEQLYGPIPDQILPACIERVFLGSILRSRFAYIVDPSGIISSSGNHLPNGYAGEMVAGEIGYAMALQMPIYAQEPLDPGLDESEGYWGLPTWRAYAETIKVKSPEEVATMAHKGKFDIRGYWWINSPEARSNQYWRFS